MKKIECYLVRDLLPLYIDHACGPETAEDIVGHLDECAACKKLYDGMNSSICDELPAPELDERECDRLRDWIDKVYEKRLSEQRPSPAKKSVTRKSKQGS